MLRRKILGMFRPFPGGFQKLFQFEQEASEYRDVQHCNGKFAVLERQERYALYPWCVTVLHHGRNMKRSA